MIKKNLGVNDQNWSWKIKVFYISDRLVGNQMVGLSQAKSRCDKTSREVTEIQTIGRSLSALPINK